LPDAPKHLPTLAKHLPDAAKPHLFVAKRILLAAKHPFFVKSFKNCDFTKKVSLFLDVYFSGRTKKFLFGRMTAMPGCSHDVICSGAKKRNTGWCSFLPDQQVKFFYRVITSFLV
jgi:hypothetical protein